MNLVNFIATRYLKSSRENRFFSWITILSLSGLAIGVAALIVVLSVINGFETELQKRFLHANAHIMAYRYPAGMKDPDSWTKVIKKDFNEHVRGISPFIHYETMAKKGSIMRAALIRGIAPELRESVQSLKELVTPVEALEVLQEEIDAGSVSSQRPPAAIIGSGLASILDLKVGDQFELISPSEDHISELQKFEVVGIYNSGLKHYDNRLIALSNVSAASFFRMNNTVTGLEIGLHDPNISPKIAQLMEEKYNLSFREWQSYNRPLFEAMERERLVISLIVAMVVVVAGFNILTTIFVSVSQKQRDISVLKAIGASNQQIIKIFVSQGIYIGIAGSILGCILALAISKILETYQFIELPDPYFLSSLPVSYSLITYLFVSLAAIIICILAALYPAFMASKVIPSEGFRGSADALS